MRDVANLSLAVGVDVLRGQIGEKECRSVLGSVRETRRTIQVGQQIGEHKQVLDVIDSGDQSNGDLLKEEQELTARLEAVRERRGHGMAKMAS